MSQTSLQREEAIEVKEYRRTNTDAQLLPHFQTHVVFCWSKFHIIYVTSFKYGVLEILIKTLRKFQEYVQNNNKNVIALDLFEKYQEGRLITSNQK